MTGFLQEGSPRNTRKARKKDEQKRRSLPGCRRCLVKKITRRANES
jgi:hypothetical protein